MSRTDLLNELRIDRGESRPKKPKDEERAWWPWVVGALAVVGVIAAIAWWVIAKPGTTEVQVVEAKATAGGAPTAGVLLDASGYVVARRQATVSSKVTGKVVMVLIEEGQRVVAGEVIAMLDSSNARAALMQATAQLRVAQASLTSAQVKLADAERAAVRARTLHDTGYLSDQATENAASAVAGAKSNMEGAMAQVAVARASVAASQQQVQDTIVRAPFTGVVTVKAAQPGEIVSPISGGGGFTRTGICTIVDMDSLELEVDVAESFINRVRQGMPAEVVLDAYPEWRIPAEVIAVIPTANRSKATVGVRIGFKTSDPRIVPEMGARVSFLSPPSATPSAAAPNARAVILPTAAILAESPERGAVFVLKGDRLERRAVRLGATGPQGQVILAGIAAGDQVVSGDLTKLKDGMRVRVTEDGE